MTKELSSKCSLKKKGNHDNNKVLRSKFRIFYNLKRILSHEDN